MYSQRNAVYLQATPMMNADEMGLKRWQILRQTIATDLKAVDAKWTFFTAAALDATHQLHLDPCPEKLFPRLRRGDYRLYDQLVALLGRMPSITDLLLLLRKRGNGLCNKQVFELFYWLIIDKFSPFLCTLSGKCLRNKLKEFELTVRPKHMFKICHTANERTDLEFYQDANPSNVYLAFFACQAKDAHSILFNGFSAHSMPIRMTDNIQMCLSQAPICEIEWRNSKLPQRVQIVLACLILGHSKLVSHYATAHGDLLEIFTEKLVTIRYILVYDASGDVQPPKVQKRKFFKTCKKTKKNASEMKAQYNKQKPRFCKSTNSSRRHKSEMEDKFKIAKSWQQMQEQQATSDIAVLKAGQEFVYSDDYSDNYSQDDTVEVIMSPKPRVPETSHGVTTEVSKASLEPEAHTNFDSRTTEEEQPDPIVSAAADIANFIPTEYKFEVIPETLMRKLLQKVDDEYLIWKLEDMLKESTDSSTQSIYEALRKIQRIRTKKERLFQNYTARMSRLESKLQVMQENVNKAKQAEYEFKSTKFNDINKLQQMIHMHAHSKEAYTLFMDIFYNVTVMFHDSYGKLTAALGAHVKKRDFVANQIKRCRHRFDANCEVMRDEVEKIKIDMQSLSKNMQELSAQDKPCA